MFKNSIEKDERSIFIENQSYKYGYMVLTFGILIDIIYRSVRFNEAPWDLFGLIFLSGLITTSHQYRYEIFSKNWLVSVLILALISAIIAAIVALLF